MAENNLKYKAIVSSDWNECLAPCGPFDFIAFNYPQLTSNLTTIFQKYTGNMISLGEAARQIQDLLPGPITKEQMDAYLDKSFITKCDWAFFPFQHSGNFFGILNVHKFFIGFYLIFFITG